MESRPESRARCRRADASETTSSAGLRRLIEYAIDLEQQRDHLTRLGEVREHALHGALPEANRFERAILRAETLVEERLVDRRVGQSAAPFESARAIRRDLDQRSGRSP